jgi:ABC-type multidrug transport system ATPase subunit
MLLKWNYPTLRTSKLFLTLFEKATKELFADPKDFKRLQVELSHIAKRFRKEWIFKGITAELTPKTSVSILGSNGSGKSTLAQIIAGYITPTQGSISWLNDGISIPREKVFKHVAICSPAIQLWEELTLKENIELFLQFKEMLSCKDYREFSHLVQLEKQANQPLKTYSSGMKQRVKLGLSILSDTELLILDEPCSHLDSSAVVWYQDLLTKNSANRLVVIASNSDEREIFCCEKSIDINSYRSQA